MTGEQKKARKISAESGNIKWIKEHCLRTKDSGEDYVFISYKSDDFEKVLDDIVYKTCKKYGLRVYFDTAFDDNAKTWIEQFYDNMTSTHCKAFIAFLDDAYYSSYATLLEMMTRKTCAAGGDYKRDTLFFLPINLEPISDKSSDANTGLGTKRYSDNKMNLNAELELKKFNEVFNEIVKYNPELEDIYKRKNDTELYEEATEKSSATGRIYLNVTQCRRLMEMVIPPSNDNDGTNKDIVEAIHDKLVNHELNSVFGTVEKEADRENSNVYASAKSKEIMINEREKSNDIADKRVVSSSAEFKKLLESAECNDDNLKKALRENKILVRISSSDISYREEYLKYDTWLFSLDKSKENADDWEFYILKRGDMGANSARVCFDATDLNVSIEIKNSIRKSHLADVRKVSLTELLSGKWTNCFE